MFPVGSNAKFDEGRRAATEGAVCLEVLPTPLPAAPRLPAKRNPASSPALLKLLRHELLHWRAGLAVLAGTVLALAFPLPGWSGFAWLGPGLILLAALGAPPGRGFRLGYLAGLVHYLVSLGWLLNIPFPAGAVAGWLALSAYMALYPALWVWICWRMLPTPPPSRTLLPTWPRALDGPGPATATAPVRPVWLAACTRVTELAWAQRTLWAVSCGAAWVGVELVAGHLFSGFPWNPLGASQYRQLPVIQVAAATGVAGVSFLVAWGSVALLLGVLRLAVRIAEPLPHQAPVQHPGPLPPAGFAPPGGGLLNFRFALITDLGLPLGVVFGLALAGTRQLLQRPPADRELTLALVQPSIPQRLIWDEDESTNRFNTLMDLSRLALAARPDLLVWPEGALPSFNEHHYGALTNLIASHRVWMVFGADDVMARAGGGEDYFNSAFLFAPDGGYVASYQKQRLVIFGEYVPLQRWLPFTKYLTPIQGSFTPGPGPVPFDLLEPRARFSPLICFEDVFGRSARHHVEPETDFLLNLTNDGWFGEGSAQWQQAAQAVFRAVENRRPLVRCTNNGLTCWVDACGRLRQVLGEPGGRVYAPGFLTVRLPLAPEGAAQPMTYYRRHGDRFGWGCAAFSVLVLGTRRLTGRSGRSDPRAGPGQSAGG